MGGNGLTSYITNVQDIPEIDRPNIIPSDLGQFNDFVASPPLSNYPDLDDGSQLIILNSTFVFNGTPYNNLYISSNGFKFLIIFK